MQQRFRFAAKIFFIILFATLMTSGFILVIGTKMLGLPLTHNVVISLGIGLLVSSCVMGLTAFLTEPHRD